MSSLSSLSATGQALDRQTLDQRIQGYIGFFETLTPKALDRIEEFFEPDAYFIDPFNEVSGSQGIRAVFAHMFKTCANPRFEVTETIAQGNVAYLTWRFTFDSGRRTRSITGVSRVTFGTRGRAARHEDYWDAAGQVYESLPLLGWLLRRLRRRLAAPMPAPRVRG